MSNTSTYADPEKVVVELTEGPVMGAVVGVAEVAPPSATLIPPTVGPTRLFKRSPRRHAYRALRITMAVLGAAIMVLSLASLVFDAIITSQHSSVDYSDCDEDQECGTMDFVVAVWYGVSCGCAAYCLVVSAVCFILTLACSSRVLAPGCCSAACLAVTVMIGVLVSIAELTLVLLMPFQLVIDGFLAVPLARILIMIAYFVLLIVCARKFPKDDAH